MNNLRIGAFERIAIVNRGEPALRLMRAVREWNCERNAAVRTLAFYTEPDRDALFVREADSSFLLGPAMFLDPRDPDEQGRPRRKSRYLDYDKLREALVRTRADAAWVGWGFVAEHAAFAELCYELGIVFIGPSPDAMRRLGDKIGSKLLAEKAGVPVAPWSGGPVFTLDEARTHAATIGFPLLVKATAGGGGRGIRFVHSDDQLATAFESASAEARKAFGDGTVFLEKKVGAARHVEVQVLADAHGTVWPVGVRDCSAQRCNQKVIEEAPSPALSPDQEKALREAAVRIARSAGYVNAGTVEFLFEPKTGDFFFMEMNTRLQVEHPVTEATTGLDLVRLQMQIARGEKLPAESPPPTRGCAIEVRLCAEDPDRSFAPAPGRVMAFRPAMGPGVRNDSGVVQNDEIPVEFDSMIAKIIAHGATREEARARLARALLETLVVVEGGTTNRAFLLRLLTHPEFISSNIDTGWIDRLMQQGGCEPGPDAYAALMVTAIELHEKQRDEEELNFFAAAARGRPALPPQQRRPIELRYGGATYDFHVSTLEPGAFRVQVDGGQIDVRLEHDGPYESRFCYDTPQGVKRHRVVSVPVGLDHLVEVDGCSYRVSRDPGGLLRAPAPGLVLFVHVTEGAQVKAGDRLLGLEAMKMEMPVTAPFDGRVRKVLVGQSVQVAAGDPLVVIEPDVQQKDAAKQTERVTFPCDVTPDEVPARAFRATLRELRRLMLGFDITDERVGALLKRWSAAFPEDPARTNGDPDSVHALPPDYDAIRELLALYLDVEALFSKQYSDLASATSRLSSEQHLHIYLREHRSEGRGLPPSFLASLRTALAHYKVTSLAESPRLIDALVWLYRSHQNVTLKNRVVVAVLQRCLDRPAWRSAVREPSFRELLDRLVALTQESHPGVCEAAQQVHYALFEGRVLEVHRREALWRVDVSLEKLHADPNPGDRAARMAEVVATPFSLMGHLSQYLESGDDAMRALVLEVMTRRFYRTQSIAEPCLLQVNGRAHLLATCLSQGRLARTVATHLTVAELDTAVAGVCRIARQLSSDARLLVDLYVSVPNAPDARTSPAALAERLTALGVDPHIERVCAVLIHPGSAVDYVTFFAKEGKLVEDEMLLGFHPTTGERLELWRLKHFKVKRVSTSQDLYLFHLRARENERDERLFGVAEIREMHPVRDAAGRLVAIPEMEHSILEAFQAIREQQARRDARRRLHWNRISVFVRPALLARREEIYEIARRLHPLARGLGLEKITLRLFLHEDASQVPKDTALSLSNRTGHRLELMLCEPHNEPLRVLDDYAIKLIRARQRRITYPYEIIKMLAPAEPAGDFPRGEFEEYDLGSNGESNVLISVKGRPFGLNNANVVVGVIKNFTETHPEGITRVLLLGDGTREMGALAEPECRRIVAAIDLAERLNVPMEWFPVSSGAKIAMDSGTENLDWTAAVLRRIIEFTQRRGEINLVVDGINVGAQSYWNAEATMLMHCRGCLIMTPRGTMLLTGKRALDYSGGISAEDNLGIGGFERIMGPNGEAQYHAHDLDEACRILMRYYDHTYRVNGERHPRRRLSVDPRDRNVCLTPYAGDGFELIGDLWDDVKNPGRKKPFDIRLLLRAIADTDCQPLERWHAQQDAEVAVVWDTHLGGWPVCMVGIESKPLQRLGYVPSDGPDTWSGGTLFPVASKKVARAINSASGNRPVVVIANLSGFDGSPESLRRLQLEYGAEIGRAVVNFQGPLVFCVVARYHGGAYVVFSKALNPSMKALALSGSYASVIGGAPAAAVVFPEEARAAALKDSRVQDMDKKLKNGGTPKPQLQQEYADLFQRVLTEKQREIAERFDAIHSVHRAREVGSLDGIIEPSVMRSALIEAVETGLAHVDEAPPPRVVQRHVAEA